MRTLTYIWFLSIAVGGLLSCNSGSSGAYDYYDNDNYVTEELYPDGEYCADVEYYNPNTGTRSTYTLNVEVEDNELTTIYWPNSGWLDGDYFSSEELDDNGYCSFRTRKGNRFEVEITGSACGYTDKNRMQNDLEEEEEDYTCPRCGNDKNEYDEYCYNCADYFTCPNCGGDKYEYDEYCDDCTDELENTCSRCGGYEYGIYGGLCSSCKEEEDEDDW